MIRSHIRFFFDYVRSNFLIALEYRATFFGQVFGMLLNDIMWIAFWVIYFTQFPVLQSAEGGWRIEDVLAMWAVVGVAFGLAMGFFGNALRMAQMISQGDLDYYLALPKNVLLHVLVSRMDLTALGDVLFGTGLFVFFLHPSPERVLLFLLVGVCGGAVFLAAAIIWQSLAFWLGNAEGLATQMWNALILLSTYPAPLFRGAVKLVIFTVVPAAFMSHIPVQLLRIFDPAWLLTEIVFAASLLTLAILIFYRGLRRYESGSLMLMRT